MTAELFPPPLPELEPTGAAPVCDEEASEPITGPK